MDSFSSLLFIEDEKGQRELTERLYQMCAKAFHGEVKFSTANGWDTGMAFLAAHPVDVVLLDLGLPPMNHTETLRTLKETRGLPPVVVLTGMVTPTIREECFAAGASDLMLKIDANHHPELLCEKAYHAYLRRLHEQTATV